MSTIINHEHIGWSACGSSASSSRELASVTKKLLAASLHKGSTEVYKRAWKLFTDWAQSSLGDTILVLTLTPAVIALFVSHLYSPYYACSTVTSYLSALAMLTS